MKNDFFVTVSDGNGGEQVILIWVPLAILAHNVVLENGGSPEVAHKASLAVIHHGKEIDYKQKLTVRRQVILSARKAADAVIDELGNGDVAAAVLEAVREGGEMLFSSKASGSGIVLDDEANQRDGRKNKGKTSTLIKITLERPMGIVFEPIGDPHECGVRILELTRGGKAYQSKELKVGDELLSMNGANITNMTFYDVVKSMSKGDAFDMTFKRPNKRGLGLSNLMKRNASKKGNQIIDQREEGTQCQKPEELPPLSPPTRPREVPPSAPTKPKSKAATSTAAKKNTNKRDKHEVEKREREAASQQEKLDSSWKSVGKKSNPKEIRAVSLDIKSNSRRSSSKKGSQLSDKRDDEPSPRQVKSNPNKKNSSRKGNESTDKRDKRAPIHNEKEIISSAPEPEPEPELEPEYEPEPYETEPEPALIPAYPDTYSVKSYDSMTSMRSSFDFFGFWPSSSRSKPEVSSATQEYIEPEHPYHPSHLIPGWSSSGTSTVSDTDNSSKALSQFDLSQLWGNNENADHGRLAPAQEENSLLDDESYREESYREDQVSLDDYSNSYATSFEDNPSWTDDCSTAASSYYSDDVSSVMSRRKKFRPIKQLRKRFMM